MTAALTRLFEAASTSFPASPTNGDYRSTSTRCRVRTVGWQAAFPGRDCSTATSGSTRSGEGHRRASSPSSCPSTTNGRDALRRLRARPLSRGWATPDRSASSSMTGKPARRQPQDRTHHLASRGAQSLTQHPTGDISCASDHRNDRQGRRRACRMPCSKPVCRSAPSCAMPRRANVGGARLRVALAEMEDADALATAFAGAEAVFILPPSDFDPEPGYPGGPA